MKNYILAGILVATMLLPTIAQAKPVDISATSGIKHPFICSDNGQSKDFVISADGKIEFEWPAVHGQDVWALPNGNYLMSHIRGAQEVTKDGNIVWEYKSPEGTEVHNCQPLPNGRVMITENGTCRIMEIDRAGVIRKSLKIDTTVTGVHDQFRNARKLANGNYLVAFMGENAVKEFNNDGELIRTIKTPGNCFCAVRLPSGNTLIACGDGHKLMEVDKKDKVVWSIDENEIPGHPLRFVAGVQRLPNGNTVVCNWGGHGYVGQQPLIFEITRDKKVVWKFDDYARFKTISSVQLLDVPGDVTKWEILR